MPILIALIPCLAGCGQKGPLVLPDAKTNSPVPVTSPAAANPDAKKNKNSPETPQSAQPAR